MQKNIKMFRVEIINLLYGEIRMSTVFAQSKRKAFNYINRTCKKNECISRCEEV